jgi:26S proteasome regulatory subunit N7
MAALYPGYCEKFGWMLDDSVLESMTAKNAEKVKEHDSK